MLLEEFDENRNAILNPDVFQKKIENMPKTCVSFFSKKIMKHFVETYNPKVIGQISNDTMAFLVYEFIFNERRFVVMQAAVGASCCVAQFEELIAMGVKNILLVGCCGCLDKKFEEYSIIIPTSAIRDEGTSYHYAPPTDETFLDKKMVLIIENKLKSLGFNYHKGKTWTTDAIFRETKDKVERRKKQGAVVVDMECSAMNELAKFRGINFGQIFYAADNLDGEMYDPKTIMISGGKTDDYSKIIPLAFECAIEIDKEF